MIYASVYFCMEICIELFDKIFFKMIELFILIGGMYALYTVGMAIATERDYREVNRKCVVQTLRKTHY